MQREKLVQFRKGLLTSDTAEALRHLEMRAAKITDMKFRLKIDCRPPTQMSWDSVREDEGPTGNRPEWSAIPTGREVYLELNFIEDPGDLEDQSNRELAILWGLVVPLGFLPWDRYPIQSKTSKVFHYPGPWHPLMDCMLGMGRGEEAWPSFCAAAQADVGSWEGSQSTERFVQAQLHRLGHNCGPVDGLIGQRTETVLRGAGYYGEQLSKVSEALSKAQPAEKPTRVETRGGGHLVVPTDKFSIVSHGQVHTTKTSTGAALDIRGPGRVVVDFR